MLRNGHRDKTHSTQVGDLDLAIPKLRSGSIGQVLHADILEAYVHGLTMRLVDDLVKALGTEAGMSKSDPTCSASSSPRPNTHCWKRRTT